MLVSDMMIVLKITPTKRKFFAIVLMAVLLFMSAGGVSAQADQSLGLDQFGQASSLSQRPLVEIVARVINIGLSILGVIAVILILYGGFVWMTSGGNEEKIEQAKAILRNAIIGLIIILSAYAIASFIIGKLREAELISGPGGLSGGGGLSLGPGSPGGLLEAVSPQPGEAVCRNTSLMLQFKVPMDKATLVVTSQEKSLINAAAVKLQVRDGSRPVITNWNAAVDTDGKVAVYGPASAVDYLGNATANQVYQVTLTNALRSVQGESVFPLEYSYTFTVLPCIDTAPPQVNAIYPDPRTNQYQDADGAYVRNTAIVMSFNKPVNPLTIAGSSAKISVRSGDAAVAGVFGPPFDQFRSVRFTPAEKCGTNACGTDIYCLPAKATMAVNALAASLSGANASNPNEAALAANGLPDGVTDGYRNSLDGGGELGVNKNNKADGPPQDNFTFSFKTSDKIDLSSPRITTIAPTRNASGVATSASVRADFTKPLSQVNSTLFTLNPSPRAGWSTGFVRQSGQTLLSALQLKPYGALDPVTQYLPAVASGLQDVNFNCYLPCSGPGCVAVGAGAGAYDPPYREGAPWAGGLPRYPSCSAFDTEELARLYRDRTRLADMAIILAGLEQYKNRYGQYPPDSADECGGFDYGWKAGSSSFIDALVTSGVLANVPRDPGLGAGCGSGYAYHRYPVDGGGAGCTGSQFFILGIKDLETVTGVAPESPGFSCQFRNWQNDFEWVTGVYE